MDIFYGLIVLVLIWIVLGIILPKMGIGG